MHTSTLDKSSWEEKHIHQKTTLKQWYKHLMTADYHEERTIFAWCLAPLSKSYIVSVSLLVKETGEYYRPVPSHCQTLSHNAVSSTPRIILIRTHNFIADKDLLHRYI